MIQQQYAGLFYPCFSFISIICFELSFRSTEYAYKKSRGILFSKNKNKSFLYTVHDLYGIINIICIYICVYKKMKKESEIEREIEIDMKRRIEQKLNENASQQFVFVYDMNVTQL